MPETANLTYASAMALWHRELVRFFRQRSRVIGALGTPILFWLLIGSGVGRSFKMGGAPEDHGYLQYFFPGTLVLILLFTAIFSTISVIDDRKAGFLQGVLVAPVGRTAVVLGKILGGTTLAVGQGLLVLLFAPLVGLKLSVGVFLISAGIMIVVAAALTGLGFFIAWMMDSVQGFHAIMNLLLMPLWLLSGAVFPPSGAAGWLKWLVYLNPLSYGLALLRDVITGTHGGLVNVYLSWGVTIGFAVVMIAACCWAVTRPQRVARA